jgi:ABC-2 type transport system permease protein
MNGTSMNGTSMNGFGGSGDGVSTLRVSPVQVARESVIFSAAEMKATFTWRSYLFAWLLRLMVQTIFFALVAGYFGTSVTRQHVLVGNAIVLGCLESMVVVLMMGQEAYTGTLPLLAMAPASHVPIYLGRGLQWMASGILSSTLGLVILPPLLRVPLPWPRAALALPLIPLICVSSYCYASVVGAIGLRHLNITWLLVNLGYLPIMTFCGVNVPVSFWPLPIRIIANVLPVTHGLAAVRDVLAGAAADTIIGQAALEALVGSCWICLAWFVLARVVQHGIAAGTLDFGG